MTLNDLVTGLYVWFEARALMVLAAGVLIPVVGTAMAWIGKKGKSQADGRFLANLFVGFSLAAVMLEVFVIAFAVGVMGADPLRANVALLAAPIVCLVGCVFGIGKVYPVNRLTSMRTFTDIAFFLAASYHDPSGAPFRKSANAHRASRQFPRLGECLRFLGHARPLAAHQR